MKTGESNEKFDFHNFCHIFLAMADGQVKYPELKGFEVYGKGNWSKIVPGKTTVKEVLDLLGKAEESANVMSLLVYPGTEKYKIFIYMTKPVNQNDSIVESMDFISKNIIPMGDVNWPDHFKKSLVRAADAGGWNEFTE